MGRKAASICVCVCNMCRKLNLRNNSEGFLKMFYFFDPSYKLLQIVTERLIIARLLRHKLHSK